MPPSSTMRAVRLHAYGPPGNLVVESVPRPQAQAGQVLVRVHAAGVNPIDWKIRSGMLQAFMPLPLPWTPGADLAGVVEAVGPGVTAFQPGQEVYGRGSGTYAEYAVAPAVVLAPKPRNLTFDQAAAIPIGALTAWLGLFDTGGLEAGQRLLVRGAAGGVGNYAVQLGRWKGAHVVGMASAGNLEFVRSLGAETVVDYNATPIDAIARDVDVALDTVGGPEQEQLLSVLKPGGVLVTVAGPPPEERAKALGVRATGAARRDDVADLLRRIAELVESGAITAQVGPVFPLEQASAAHALSETGHGRGRIVLHVADA